MSSGTVCLPALHQACRDGDANALGLLIDRATDRLEIFHRMCEYDSSLGWTPAHWAAYHGKIECFRRLLCCGLNIDVGDCRYRRTPAHIAAFAGHPHMLIWLLQAGADPNKQDDNGDTLVHHAARSGSNECLQILQSHNSYMCLSNKIGQIPYDVSILCGFDHSAEYLTHFQPQPVVSVPRSLKRSLDEDVIYGGVKKICNGFTWPKENNGIPQEHIGLHNMSSPMGNDVITSVSTLNGHADHDMEIQNDDNALPTSEDFFTCSSPTDKLYPSPTKLSMPQRCMGSHYM